MVTPGHFPADPSGAAGSRLNRQRRWDGEAAALVLATQEFVANGARRPPAGDPGDGFDLEAIARMGACGDLRGSRLAGRLPLLGDGSVLVSWRARPVGLSVSLSVDAAGYSARNGMSLAALGVGDGAGEDLVGPGAERRFVCDR
jgi:hypothetical protein